MSRSQSQDWERLFYFLHHEGVHTLREQLWETRD